MFPTEASRREFLAGEHVPEGSSSFRTPPAPWEPPSHEHPCPPGRGLLKQAIDSRVYFRKIHGMEIVAGRFLINSSGLWERAGPFKEEQ